tara:strand:- start:33762 stop:33962 length:201 start_codon:yes stop_codon:yes gene_type:complete
MKKRTDKDGRVWEYNDAEGNYSYKKACIGCGGRNGSKFTDWNRTGCEEFNTLREAMASCGFIEDNK